MPLAGVTMAVLVVKVQSAAGVNWVWPAACASLTTVTVPWHRPVASASQQVAEVVEAGGERVARTRDRGEVVDRQIRGADADREDLRPLVLHRIGGGDRLLDAGRDHRGAAGDVGRMDAGRPPHRRVAVGEHERDVVVRRALRHLEEARVPVGAVAPVLGLAGRPLM